MRLDSASPQKTRHEEARLPRWRNAVEQLHFLTRRALRAALGLHTPLPTEDRRVFEQLVMPYFAAHEEYRRVLFVGCDWYTKHYADLFAEREYWTLEKDPGRARYGAQRHVTDTLAGLRRHFAEGSLDLVLCNGVVGWGLNELGEAEVSFEACFEALRGGGVLVVGWNDVPHKRPFRLEECRALSRFEPFVFPPLGTAQHVVPVRLRHTFSFFLKPS